MQQTYEQRKRRRETAHVDTTGGRTDLVTRKEAAEIMGMSIRSVSRYAELEYLTKFTDARGRVFFAPEQCRAMGYAEAETRPGRRPSG